MNPTATKISLSLPVMNPIATNLLLLLLVGAAATMSMETDDQLVPPEPETNSVAPASCLAHEREALLAFKRGITGDPVGRLASWRKEDHDCCRWRGVVCSNITGHVLELHLQNNLLTWYSDFVTYDSFKATALSGLISSPLLALEHLEHLDLSYNDLTGTAGRLPEFVGSLKNLRYLNLSGMSFTSNVPPHLGNLSKLQYLDLSHGKDMHSTDISWLTHLSWLRYLDLSYVNLSTIPYDWFHVINMNRNLRTLCLSDCSLVSASQSFLQLNLTELQKLDLSDNNFNHRLASCWFWNLTNLAHLNLMNDMLYGQFPNALGNMTSLQIFEFASYGGAGCTLVPSLLRNLCNLEILEIDAGLSSGNVTEMLKNFMQYCSANKLRELVLSDNNIIGTLPTGLGKFTSLETLILSVNQLTGSVPYKISMLTSLTHLDLSFNNLTGEITEDHLAGLKSLKVIDLSYNYYLKIKVGAEWLPPFQLDKANFAYCQMGLVIFPLWPQWLVGIEWLDIPFTGTTGELPHCFSTVLSKALSIDMSNNQISGSLPANMEIMSVKHLDLGSNQITGEIPMMPTNLTHLDISNNMLSGFVSSKTFGPPQLEYINLSSNRIKGPIVRSFCGLQYLHYLDLSNNMLEGEFPECFQMRNKGKQPLLVSVSNNSLSGRFPSFLQGCKQLYSLDLSRNKFHGSLPSWIGELQELETLVLSYNMFSGHIPASIINLTQLHQLKLASNNISGALP